MGKDNSFTTIVENECNAIYKPFSMVEVASSLHGTGTLVEAVHLRSVAQTVIQHLFFEYGLEMKNPSSKEPLSKNDKSNNQAPDESPLQILQCRVASFVRRLVEFLPSGSDFVAFYQHNIQPDSNLPFLDDGIGNGKVYNVSGPISSVPARKCLALEIIKGLGQFLSKVEGGSFPMIKYFEEALKSESKAADKNRSITQINAGRFEIFFGGDGYHSSTAILALIRWVIPTISNDVLTADSALLTNGVLTAESALSTLKEYVISQARSVEQYRHYDFQMMSLILSFGDVAQQVEHRDISQAMVQAICPLKDDTAGTLVFKPRFECSSFTDLVNRGLLCRPPKDGLLEKVMFSPTEVPDFLLAEAESSRSLISEFGAVLNTEYSVLYSSRCILDAGDMDVIPGKWIHAGPASTGFRGVIFAAGAPVGVEPYQGDTQYSRVSLFGSFLETFYNDVPMEDQEYLVRGLVHLCQSDVSLDIARGQGDICAGIVDDLRDLYARRMSKSSCPHTKKRASSV